MEETHPIKEVNVMQEREFSIMRTIVNSTLEPILKCDLFNQELFVRDFDELIVNEVPKELVKDLFGIQNLGKFGFRGVSLTYLHLQSSTLKQLKSDICIEKIVDWGCDKDGNSKPEDYKIMKVITRFENTEHQAQPTCISMAVNEGLFRIKNIYLDKLLPSTTLKVTIGIKQPFF